LGPLTDPWGIEDRFHDAFGRERVTGDETRAEVLAAMGVAPGAPDAGPTQVDIRVVVAGAGDRLEMNGHRGGELRL
jgi:hypothetical protein